MGRAKMTLPEAFNAELKQWRVTFEQESLLRAFCVCLSERLAGRDPAALLPKKNMEFMEGGE
jgi:hypothetical protein